MDFSSMSDKALLEELGSRIQRERLNRNMAQSEIALKAGVSGVLYGPSSYFCKHPARQYPDDECYRQTEEFIKKYSPAHGTGKKTKR